LCELGRESRRINVPQSPGEPCKDFCILRQGALRVVCPNLALRVGSVEPLANLEATDPDTGAPMMFPSEVALVIGQPFERRVTVTRAATGATWTGVMRATPLEAVHGIPRVGVRLDPDDPAPHEACIVGKRRAADRAPVDESGPHPRPELALVPQPTPAATMSPARRARMIEDEYARLRLVEFKALAMTQPPFAIVATDRRIEYVSPRCLAQFPVLEREWSAGRLGGESLHAHFIGRDRRVLRAATCPICIAFDSGAPAVGRIGVEMFGTRVVWSDFSVHPRRGGGVVALVTGTTTEFRHVRKRRRSLARRVIKTLAAAALIAGTAIVLEPDFAFTDRALHAGVYAQRFAGATQPRARNVREAPASSGAREARPPRSETRANRGGNEPASF
jgi:hypothetical protein